MYILGMGLVTAAETLFGPRGRQRHWGERKGALGIADFILVMGLI